MPIHPLAKAVLLFLDNVPELPSDRPFDVLPWNNDVWRQRCRIRPFRRSLASDKEELNTGEEGGDSTETVELDDGLVFDAAVLQAVKPKEKKWFSDENREQAGAFLQAMLVRAHQERRAIPTTTAPEGGKKGRKKKVKPPAPQSCLVRCDRVNGYSSFRNIMLAVLNQRDGVMAEIIAIMEEARRTPAHGWKDLNAHQLSELMLAGVKELDTLTDIPSAEKYLGDLQLHALVAESLFGTSAILAGSGRAADVYAAIVRCLLQRCWERLLRQTLNHLARGFVQQEKYEAAFLVAQAKPTLVRLRAASRALANWKEFVRITAAVSEDVVLKLDEDMEKLWLDLGFARNKHDGSVTRPTAKRTIEHISDEEMRMAYIGYLELHFPAEDDATVTEIVSERLLELPTDGDSSAVINILDDKNIDYGVADYRLSTVPQLFGLLGLATQQLPYMSSNMKVKWHQLVGVASIIKAMYTPRLGMPPRPTLLCDDVGLGKTAQTIGVISMLSHLIELQRKGHALPPLLADNPYFAGMEKIPDLPSLIVAPLTLIRQWKRQIELFTARGSFRVIVYTKEDYGHDFFAKGGFWQTHVMGAEYPHRIILIVPMAGIQAESAHWVTQPQKGVAGKPELFQSAQPKLKAAAGPNPPTLMDKKFLFIAIDEIHTQRNANTTYQGIVRLASNAVVRMGATATPIFTAPSDLVAQGRMLRYLRMIGGSGEELCTAMEDSERGRGRIWSRNKATITARLRQGDTTALLEEKFSERQQVDSKPMDDADVIVSQFGDSTTGYKASYVCYDSIKMAREALLPIVIRRTGKSLDHTGAPIMSLKPYVEAVAWTIQWEAELEAAKARLSDVMETREDEDENTKESKVRWKHFFIDDKMQDFHHKLDRRKDLDATAFWNSWTRESLPSAASAKIMRATEIIEHYDDVNAQPLYFNRDGTRNSKEESLRVGEPARAKRKIILFLMYHVQRKLMMKVLSLLGRKYVEYDGKMDERKRQKAIDQFETDGDLQIMLISNVGTTGLNLTVASVIIFLSGLWSGMEIWQTIGRLWREGQIELVHVYHIIATNSVDELLSGYANGKTELLGRLFDAKDVIERIARPAHPDVYSDEEDEESMPPEIISTSSRVKSRTLKQPATATEPPPSTGASSKKRKTADATSEATNRKKMKPSAETSTVAKPGEKSTSGRKSRKRKDIGESPPTSQQPSSQSSDQLAGASSHGPTTALDDTAPLSNNAPQFVSEGLNATLPRVPQNTGIIQQASFQDAFKDAPIPGTTLSNRTTPQVTAYTPGGTPRTVSDSGATTAHPEAPVGAQDKPGAHSAQPFPAQNDESEPDSGISTTDKASCSANHRMEDLALDAFVHLDMGADDWHDHDNSGSQLEHGRAHMDTIFTKSRPESASSQPASFSRVAAPPPFKVSTASLRGSSTVDLSAMGEGRQGTNSQAATLPRMASVSPQEVNNGPTRRPGAILGVHQSLEVIAEASTSRHGVALSNVASTSTRGDSSQPTRPPGQFKATKYPQSLNNPQTVTKKQKTLLSEFDETPEPRPRGSKRVVKPLTSIKRSLNPKSSGIGNE